MANKNFSSKRLIQDTGRKMGLATTVKRAQKRDPSEETFFDKKRGKELAAVSKEDMKDAGFTSFGKDSLGEYLNMKKKLGRKPKKSDFSTSKTSTRGSKVVISGGRVPKKKDNKTKNFSSKSLITKKNIESGIPKKKQSVITSSYNRKPNTSAMSYRKKGGDLFVAKQYGGKII